VNGRGRRKEEWRKKGIEKKEENGAPEKIRTPNPQIRSLVLYPVRSVTVNHLGYGRWDIRRRETKREMR
jgi:hypothetical protein